MNVRLQLPHTVYMLPKQSVEKSELHIVRAELDAAQNKVTVEVENTGNNFGRIIQTQLLYAKKKQDAQGFPIFPRRRNRSLRSAATLGSSTGKGLPPRDVSRQKYFETIRNLLTMPCEGPGESTIS